MDSIFGGDDWDCWLDKIYRLLSCMNWVGYYNDDDFIGYNCDLYLRFIGMNLEVI